eukprot:3236329-Rhodomonas_salina.4
MHRGAQPGNPTHAGVYPGHGNEFLTPRRGTRVPGYPPAGVGLELDEWGLWPSTAIGTRMSMPVVRPAAQLTENHDVVVVLLVLPAGHPNNGKYAPSYAQSRFGAQARKFLGSISRAYGRSLSQERPGLCKTLQKLVKGG